MNSFSLSATIGLLALTAFAQSIPSYSDAEAAKHIGEEATVTGKLFTVSSSGKGNTFLNFGDRYPRHTFSAVVFSRNAEAVGDVKQYEGKTVSVTGKIESSPDQKPQIVLTKAAQIKIAGAGGSPPPPLPTPAPAAPASSPSPTPAPAPTAPAPGGIPMAELPKGATKGKIALAGVWSGSAQGGELTRKDLAQIFGAVGAASDVVEVDRSIEAYPGLPILTPLEAAKKMLNLDGASSVKTKIVTPGMPKASFTAYTFSGVFAGGFNRLSLITDTEDQVVSVFAMDTASRTRVANETDTAGYHTYNFITGKAKATKDVVVRHTIVPESVSSGTIIVDTLLVDPTDPESPPPRTSGKSSSTKFSSSSKPKTGKVLERSRWYVPKPVVNLILRCVVR